MNLFRSRIPVLGAVVALVLLAGACGDAAADNTVAEIGDSSLSLDDVVALMADDSSPTLDKTEAASTITGWLRNEVWYAELAAEDFEVSDAHLAAARAELEQIALTDPTVPDLDTPFGELIVRSQALPDIVAEYLVDRLGAEPVWPVQLCSSHILLDTEEEALAAIGRLEAGEDFVALATELSTDPSAATNGGNLGCVDPSGFVPEFVAGAALVEAPGLSEPVESQFGWHVIDVHSFDATPSDDPDALLNALFATEEFAAMQVAALARPVTIDPTYGTWDADQLIVVAPAG